MIVHCSLLLGLQVWTVAHVMCRELAAHPEAVAGARVLELGAGTGVCGILAAKLGAAQVVLLAFCWLRCVALACHAAEPRTGS